MPVTVVVVSRERPDALARCLLSLTQLDHRDFELVVVCDPKSAAMLAARKDAARIKWAVCDAANISKARNQAIAHASGTILAFIDDDAVAEPTWLGRLIAPFDDPQVVATGGFVRGRNGVSYQWRASSTDASGMRKERRPDEPLPPGEVWRTEGTNMAFRADALRAIGGFDEAFAFYLDETDVNLRLPGQTVIVPQAEVHHGFAASAHRRADRVPRSLYEIGASCAFFWQKHGIDAIALKFKELMHHQQRRLHEHFIAGRLEPRDVQRLLSGLRDGFDAGLQRHTRYGDFNSPESTPHRRFLTTPAAPKKTLSGPWSDRKALLSQANKAAAAGSCTTLVLFAPDPRALQVRFVSPGVWTHIGGQFGRGLRDEPKVRWARRDQRVSAEILRAATIRDLPPDACALQKPC